MTKRRDKVPLTNNFEKAAKRAFAFLLDLGFQYRGENSCEIGFAIIHQSVRYSMSEFIRVIDPSFADQYRFPTGITEVAIADGLSKVAQIVKTYCAPIFQGELDLFTVLDKQREVWNRRYKLAVLAEKLRPLAEEAFRTRDYGKAADLYRRIEPMLSRAERKKLDAADARAKKKRG
jgi:hypothetical protein